MKNSDLYKFETETKNKMLNYKFKWWHALPKLRKYHSY